MKAVSVRDLSKTYRVPVRGEGLLRSLGAVFSRSYRHVTAVDRVSFEVGAGEVVGFLGPNGAGKTTTLKMLSGLLHPSSGTVSVLGHEPSRREREFQRRLALVMGNRNQLWWELPAQETLRLNKEIYRLSDKDYKKSLDELTELLGLAELLSVPVKKLSLGQRMKAELAVSLLHRPKLLLLDEPTIGLDVVMQKALRAFVRDYNVRHGATVLLTSHNMDDVAELCERVLIIDRGAILYDGSLRQVVKRFAATKLITAHFKTAVEVRDLAAIGRVTDAAPGRASIEVPREAVSERAAKLLSSFPVEDLSIEELPIDEVIRRVFTQGPGGPAAA